MKRTIVLDMDGTIYNLEAVKNWLPRLRAGNNAVYIEGKPLIDIKALNEITDKLRNIGYNIDIVTWGAMNGTDDFLHKTKIAKMSWLSLYKVKYDNFHILHYGTPKESVYETVKPTKGHKAILFDDNKLVRENWSGISHDEKNLIRKLELIYGQELAIMEVMSKTTKEKVI